MASGDLPGFTSPSKAHTLSNRVFDGYESIGGLHFAPVRLDPGESKSYTLILGIIPVMVMWMRWLTVTALKRNSHCTWQENQAYWQDKALTLRFTHQDDRLDGWLQWVTLQPILRRIMGNSFLPYHDYGRGGRGWRDLWQDLLTLLLTEGRGLRTCC
jgi:cellobiose phosphorylase